MLSYYRTEMQRAILPPLPLLVKGQGRQLPPAPAITGQVGVTRQKTEGARHISPPSLLDSRRRRPPGPLKIDAYDDNTTGNNGKRDYKVQT